jgi:uncharacterized protein (DUF1778 family)
MEQEKNKRINIIVEKSQLIQIKKAAFCDNRSLSNFFVHAAGVYADTVLEKNT